MLCVSECVADCIRLTIPQAPEWQRIGNQIDAAFIFARADFVNVCELVIMPGQRFAASRLVRRFSQRGSYPGRKACKRKRLLPTHRALTGLPVLY
jgi:hypothetical protein